jgi:hypothetical protein
VWLDHTDHITSQSDQCVLFMQHGPPGRRLRHHEHGADADIHQFTQPLLTVVEPDIHRRLDHDFYDPRIQTLTPAEQDLLLTTALCPYPPLRVSDLNEHSAKRPGNINVLLGRLVEAGVLFRIRKGEYEYTAPGFRDFLTRRVKDLAIGAQTELDL